MAVSPFQDNVGRADIFVHFIAEMSLNAVVMLCSTIFYGHHECHRQ